MGGENEPWSKSEWKAALEEQKMERNYFQPRLKKGILFKSKKEIEVDIQVTSVRLQPGNRKLKAFVDVKLGDLLVRDFRVMQEDAGKPHVKVPFSTYKGKDGRLKFNQIIDLPAEVRGRIETAILSAFYAREKEIKDGKADA